MSFKMYIKWNNEKQNLFHNTEKNNFSFSFFLSNLPFVLKRVDSNGDKTEK